MNHTQRLMCLQCKEGVREREREREREKERIVSRLSMIRVIHVGVVDVKES